MKYFAINQNTKGADDTLIPSNKLLESLKQLSKQVAKANEENPIKYPKGTKKSN